MILEYLTRKLYDWPLMRMLIRDTMRLHREDMLKDICTRVSIRRMREILDEAEKNGDKYTTLARLLEQNYEKSE